MTVRAAMKFLSTLLAQVCVCVCYKAAVKVENFEQASSESFPVDAVYTWVKAPEPNSEELKEIGRSCGRVDARRFRNFGTLRASVLSLQAYAPWIRKVFIVTAGEVPCWAGDVDHVEMVTHKQIYPKEFWASDLPTHNSLSLETHLHKVPGLAEHFIYFNNDQFIGRPVDKDSFFTPAGKAVYLGSSWQAKHQATPVRKSAILEDQKRIPFHFSSLSHQRCRPAGSIHPPFFGYQTYHLSHGYAIKRPGKVAFLADYNIASADDIYSAIKRDRPERFTINDDFSTKKSDTLETQTKMLSRFLSDYFKDVPGFSQESAHCASKDPFFS